MVCAASVWTLIMMILTIKIMKKITIYKDEKNYVAVVYDGNKKTTWDKLTKEEQQDLLNGMSAIYSVLAKYTADGEIPVEEVVDKAEDESKD